MVLLKKTRKAVALLLVAVVFSLGFAAAPQTVFAGNGEDDIAPKITGIRILTPTVQKPGLVKVEVDVVEEGSGVRSVWMSLSNGSTSISLYYHYPEYYYGTGTDPNANYSGYTGTVVLTANVAETQALGEYKISDMTILDEYGNSTWYSNYDYISGGQTDWLMADNHSIVHGKVVPSEYCYVDGYMIYHYGDGESSHEYIEMPGYVSGWGGYTEQKDGKTYLAYYYDSDIGTSVEGAALADYIIPDADVVSADDKAIYVAGKTVAITDEYNFKVVTGLANPTYLTQIQAMPEGAAAKLKMDAKTSINEGPVNVLKKEAFDAIKGLDKTLVVYNDYGLRWVFNGLDIVNETKDVQLDVAIGMLKAGTYYEDPYAPGYGTTTGAYYDTSLWSYGYDWYLYEESGNTWTVPEDCVKIEFPANGVLPGKATVRFKSDYLYERGISGYAPHLYFSDGTTLQDETDGASFDLTFDGTDKWCHFDVTHNSTFLITSGQLSDSAVKEIASQITADVYTPPAIATQDETANVKTVANRLKSLKASKGKLSPAFKNTKKSYKLVLKATQSSTKLTVKKAFAAQKIQIKVGGAKYKKVSSASIKLAKGKKKTVYVKVSAEGQKDAVYKIVVSRKK